jgi:DNA-binding XRE family transcriptional regulator
MRSLADINASLAVHEVAAAERSRLGAQKRRQRGGPSELTRQRIRTGQVVRQRKLLTDESGPLRRARLERGLTQNEAAVKCAVSTRSYQRVERGQPVSELTLHRVARAFRLPVEAL